MKYTVTTVYRDSDGTVTKKHERSQEWSLREILDLREYRDASITSIGECSLLLIYQIFDRKVIQTFVMER